MIVALSALVLVAACASIGREQRDAELLARFEAAALAPVDSFRFLRLQGYTVLAEDRLVVWTRNDEAWLLRVDLPCNELRWAPMIGLSSSLSSVHARFDRVLAGGDRCRIREIRPVDVEAMRSSGSPPGPVVLAHSMAER